MTKTIPEVVARTGKLTGTTKILIPYFDTEGMRQWTMITLTGSIYASKMYAGIREFVKKNFGIEVDKDWLIHIPLITNSNDPELAVSEDESKQLIEELIQRLELKDEDESDTDTAIESSPAEEATASVRPVSEPSTGEQA